MTNKFATALKGRSANERVEPISGTRATSNAPSLHDRPSRKNTKHVGGYFSPEVSKQLRQIALDENSSVQVLLAEACLLYTSPSPRDRTRSRMPSSA